MCNYTHPCICACGFVENIDALRNLAICHMDGRGVEKDVMKAVSYFKRGAEAGDHVCQYNVGNLLMTGRLLKQDIKRAENMYERAARGGMEEAQLALGLHFINFKNDQKTGMAWIHEAAKQGMDRAHMCLALQYLQGSDDVPVDVTKGFMHAMYAAEKKLPNALDLVGACYSTGKGVAKDDAKAREYFMAAAEQGFVQSYYNLGVFHMQKEMFKEAAVWFSKAAEAGDKESADILQQVRELQNDNDSTPP